MARNEPLSKGEKRLLIASIAFVIAAGAIGYGFYSINVNPVVKIPEPTMPSPNARDVYMAAQGLMVYTMNVGTGPSGYSLSIDDVYGSIQAGKIVPNPKRPGTPVPKLADMQALTAMNAPVFNMVRQGFACEYRETPARSFSQLFPHYSKLRSMARVMRADGDVKCVSGDWDGGAERFIDIMRVGNDIPRGGVLIAGLVGVAIQAIGREDAWDTVDHVSAAGARRAARRLEAMAATRVSYADVLQEEEWAGQAGLLEMFNTPRWRTQFIPMLAANSGSGPGTAAFALRIQTASKRTIMANYTRYMDTLIANERNPSAAKPLPAPTDPVSSMLVPVFAKAKSKFVTAESEHNRLLLAYALRAYKLEHGAYPKSLNALAPAYLKAVPADPAAPGGTFQYARTGDSYTLSGAGEAGVKP